ncbi:Tco6 SGD histidine kinase sensor protein [Agaricus bisporus var. bisporus H97]|uniref:Tco6 SGD histidine kinase sensor protein n=1 Tax=Agaricus bisporus var. bisporus (strain H97 / ATCC MYA-4626 / FGSC 10389) TaxID=936046 RepID=UPI00029F6AA3|nr:Tco6 SGD histidine kinase sensor protein [Agaricus bisporus var. bisporus H97]EKV49219.1 Tco6 SGD histidine kinase sensor protein [Agaricus bisporus var. bisporus H97]
MQANALGMTFPNLPNLPSLPNLPNGVRVTHVATDLLDAADRHVPTLKLNARRKFFHGLAVVMFVPGVALDPAFTHLSFDVAFALFIFAEYIRYFAIYPLGVTIHLFMNEFLDEKDDGTAILSHFYLLSGCAGSLWLEGPSRLLQYTGILALGVGDAVASIVGKRIGKHRWSHTTSKTLEGTLAFVASVILSAWLLRLLGFAEPFSTTRYLLGVAISAVLEALSDQNDNLTMPLYMWSILVLRPSRKPSRPSTAPALDGTLMLPLGSSAPALSGKHNDVAFSADQCGFPLPSNGIVRYSNGVARRSEEPLTISSPSISSGSSPGPRSATDNADLDWPTFIHIYAQGRWDPHRTPSRPKRYNEVNRPPATETSNLKSQQTPVQSSTTATSTTANSSFQELQVLQKPSFILPNAPPTPLKFHGFRTNIPLSLPSPSHRIRNSFSNAHSTPYENLTTTTAAANAELQTTVATMRWAASRVDISPLALPSPEHELADPMRGVMAALPNNHTSEMNSDYAITPGGTRKSRLTEFWEGTTDVEEVESPKRISEGSYPETKESHLLQLVDPTMNIVDRNGDSTTEQRRPYYSLLTSVPAATAPSRDPSVTTEEVESESESFGNYSNSSLQSILPDFVPATEPGISSVPAVAKRASFTRQFSSPLPAAVPSKGTRANRTVSDVRQSRLSKEEKAFDELQYLAPPYPADEVERRRALYKYNIWNTGPDINFDRIAHLAKLVFNTKGVMIAFIDGGEVGDEPMVVMDAHVDWRFARNPMVAGGPKVRFFAGAPLRTQDGYNVGTLALIDDTPRDDFSPRQRHTLKEFAAIVVREMELWRDKIQLRIRDRIQNSMEQFSRECLEIDEESPTRERSNSVGGSSMDKVYDRAAKLVKRTLDVEGVIVMDVSHCQVLETMSAEANVAVTMHFGEPGTEMRKQKLTTDEYHRLNVFFTKSPEGKISEGIVPTCFRPFLPTRIQYALSVIILSAVLKRRMILADKAKSLFISNISHELRTPLHGILAAAELLGDTSLNPSQLSYLQTVQACGTSLVETVNHVLDFTKLSGNSKAGGVEHAIVPSSVDLMQLVEEAVDGCWVGHRARTANLGDSGIGSVYSPPKEENGDSVITKRRHVETVIDIGHKKEGWRLRCEKGGIRRVLMNLFGNSLKFTTDGYIHVMLHQLPRSEDDPPNKVRVELVVLDSGKGISQHFLKNQLFHPFSQENPLQTGTGLGLAIVSSIVTSEVVGGKVDVWSQEGVGTEIKVTFNAEMDDDESYENENEINCMEPIKPKGETFSVISLVGFDNPHRGTQLLERVLRLYLERWWHLEVVTGADNGDVVIVNEDMSLVLSATERNDISRSFIIMSCARGSPTLMHVATQFEQIGGFCRIIYKPGGPSRLRSVLDLAIHYQRVGRATRSWSPSAVAPSSQTEIRTKSFVGSEGSNANESKTPEPPSYRPPSILPPSSSNGSTRNKTNDTAVTSNHPLQILMPSAKDASPSRISEFTASAVVHVGDSGTLLKSSLQSEPVHDEKKFRVLVVEDNGILRNLLTKWLSNKGYEFRHAVDGQAGVSVYNEEGPFDVILLDLSMPVLDGVSATAMIRRKEREEVEGHRARILALTGMSSLEDKRRAFEAGVDGYLIKPVAFKILDEMFRKMGLI